LFLSQAHFTVSHSGVVTRNWPTSSDRYRENAATFSSRVGNKTQPSSPSFLRPPAPSPRSCVHRAGFLRKLLVVRTARIWKPKPDHRPLLRGSRGAPGFAQSRGLDVRRLLPERLEDSVFSCELAPDRPRPKLVPRFGFALDIRPVPCKQTPFL